ncbi:MAG: multicopper oxidase domain-containing protein [Chloroflexota bacterium]|nr:multicopper oxidase domain-containing protein [Chloroflexota bacterium]
MKTFTFHQTRAGLLLLSLILAMLVSAFPVPAQAAVLPASTCAESGGVRTCDLWATTGTLTLPGSVSVTIWGYAADNLSPAGLPGPLLIANAGETLVINLYNNLGEATSLSIPGLPGKSDTVGAPSGGTVTYTYANLQPGTYIYQAGPTANGERQVAMGMYGVLIVRPAGAPQEAYGPASAFNDEAVLVMSEIDPLLHASPTTYDMRNYTPRYFLFNGKAYPNTDPIDTAAGNTLLLRLVNAGIHSRSLGVLGLRYSVLSMDGKAFSRPHFAVAETLGAGQTADVLISIPAGAAANQKYAVYDTSLRLINNGSRFGGMLTFIQVGGAPAVGDSGGPASSSAWLVPNPSNGASLVTLTATVSDISSGGSNVDQAEYFIGSTGAAGTGIPLSAADSAFDSVTEAVTAVIDPSPLPSGSHTIYIHGRDAAGNWGAFTSVILVLDKAGPAMTGLTATPNPTFGTSNVALSATANDSASGNSNVTDAEYFIDAPGADGFGTAMTVSQNAPVTAVTATIPAATMNGLSEGSHWVYIHSRDAYGNWGAFASLELKIDKTGPAASALQLRPNPNNGALPYAPSFQSVRLDATFTEPGAGPTTSNIANAEFFIDTIGANGTGILITPSDGLFNSPSENGYSYIPLITVNTLSEGPHVISVHAKDAVGNWGPFSAITLMIDKTAPSVSGLTLTPSTTSGSAVSINAVADDTASGGSNITTAEYFIDTVGAPGAGTLMTLASVSPSASLSATIPASRIATLAIGNHTVYVRAKDAAGNWSALASATLTVQTASPTLYFSTLGNTNPPGVTGTADNADIYAWNGTAFSRVFDATTAGVPDIANVDGLEVVDATHFYLSFVADTTIAGFGTVQDEDIVYYDAGTWSVYFDGTAQGLTADNLDIDAFTINGGTLYFSTLGNTNPPGVTGTADNADIYAWNGTAFSRVFDATTAGVPGAANVDGMEVVDATHFYLSFVADTTITGFGTVQDEDIVYYNAGAWSVHFDGTARGLTAANHDIDAFDVP